MTTLQTEDTRTAESLIRAMQSGAGSPCESCRAPLSQGDVLGSIAMGFQNALRCVPCLAVALGNEEQTLRTGLMAYFQHRECFREAWAWAQGGTGAPAALLAKASEDSHGSPTVFISIEDNRDASLRVATSWDAGDMGCGDLVLELRLRLQALQPGQVFKLTARDAGAPEDLPAWCRLTGHTLLRAQHPDYWIQRKD
jgi:tRNA 2-thiouridine synthesizing protein A